MGTRGAPAAPAGVSYSAESESRQLHQNTSLGPNLGANTALIVEAYLPSAENNSSEELRAKQGISVVERRSEEIRLKQGIMATTGSTTAVAESPKVAKMVKSGLNFVIPKNKLLGAMVPVSRSATKWEPLDPKKEEVKPPVRKTKWGPDLTQDAVVKKGRALALQTRAEQLAAQLESGNLDIDSNEDTRSPSPPPLYDTLGHRMNTREGRKREQLDIERREAIGECMKLNSAYKPPSGYKPIAKEAKLYIPVKEHPGYNFIGLILGPRGNTQKRMEAETGAKITIRGKGAVKEGKMQSARNGKDMDGASEELHVHISADTFEKVDAAVLLIEPLLMPVDEDRNMHKMKQLRELAEMNGTLNDFTRVCGLCGEAGHREWQCPKEKLQSFQANVVCQICGDGGHPTIDCSRKNSGQGATFDKEYLNFLEELGTGLEGVGTTMTGDQPSGPITSQPMLLTTLGAQPIPVRWTAPPNGADPSGVYTPRGPPVGTSDGGTVPRFPTPPTSQPFNPFLPRFFQPGGMSSGHIRGQPFPGPPMTMMGNMLPAFRGQSPTPAGLASSMGPPTLPVTNAGVPLPPTNSPMPGKTPSFGPGSEAKFSGNPGFLRGSPSVSNTQDGARNAAVPTPSFSLPGPSNAYQSSNFGSLPRASTLAAPVQSFPATSASKLLPLESAHPTLPPGPVHPVTPSLAGILPIRPVIPSIRPALPGSVAQGPSFAGGPGQALPNGIPTIGGTGNVALPPANNSFPRPPQPQPGIATPLGAQGQFPGPHPSQPFFDRPPPASVPRPPMNNQPLQSPIRVSSPAPMAAPSIFRGPFNSNSLSVSSSFTAVAPQDQFMINPSNQLTTEQPSQPGPRSGFPPFGSQMRAANPATLPGGISSLSPPFQQTAVPQQNVFRPPQELPRSSVLHQGNLFPPRADFPPQRPQVGAQVRGDFRNSGLHQHQQGILASPGSILGSPAYNRPLLGPPQDAFNRVSSPNLPGPHHTRSPAPNFAGGMGAPYDPFRNRPDMQQLSGRPPIAAIRGWNPDPHMRPQTLHAPPRPQMQEVDPEYEKLMASVGVL